MGCALAAMLVACGGSQGDADDGGVDPDAASGSGRDSQVRPQGDSGADGGVEELFDYDAGLIETIVPGDDPPELSTLAYYDDKLGPRILMRGRDPNGDVASYTISLFKGKTPAQVDVNGDQISGESEFTGEVAALPGTAAFVYRLEPSLEFLENVDTIRVRVFDKGGRVSSELEAKLRSAPGPTGSATCDPLGFVACAGSSVCTTNAMRNTCVAASAARTSACANAVALTPPRVTTVRSEAVFSLWDAPPGCLSGDPKFRPDRVVKLRLDRDAAKVVLSTANDYTNFDTVLYQLPGCNMEPAPCTSGTCSCADDSPGSNKAQLTLTNVRGGTDYFIVVDSFKPFDPFKSRFELTVSVE